LPLNFFLLQRDLRLKYFADGGGMPKPSKGDDENPCNNTSDEKENSSKPVNHGNNKLGNFCVGKMTKALLP